MVKVSATCVIYSPFLQFLCFSFKLVISVVPKSINQLTFLIDQSAPFMGCADSKGKTQSQPQPLPNSQHKTRWRHANMQQQYQKTWTGCPPEIQARLEPADPAGAPHGLDGSRGKYVQQQQPPYYQPQPPHYTSYPHYSPTTYAYRSAPSAAEADSKFRVGNRMKASLTYDPVRLYRDPHF